MTFLIKQNDAQLTIENWALEVAEELQEHVFFLGSQLVEASFPPSSFHLSAVKPFVDVGFEPFFGHLEELSSTLTLGEPPLVEWELLLFCRVGSVFFRNLTGSFGKSSIAIGGDVSDQIGVFAFILVGIPSRVSREASGKWHVLPSIGEGYSLSLGITVLEIFLLFFRHVELWEWRVSGEAANRKEAGEEITRKVKGVKVVRTVITRLEEERATRGRLRKLDPSLKDGHNRRWGEWCRCELTCGLAVDPRLPSGP